MYAKTQRFSGFQKCAKTYYGCHIFQKPWKKKQWYYLSFRILRTVKTVTLFVRFSGCSKTVGKKYILQDAFPWLGSARKQRQRSHGRVFHGLTCNGLGRMCEGKKRAGSSCNGPRASRATQNGMPRLPHKASLTIHLLSQSLKNCGAWALQS